jgi:hypothetical protein
MYRVVLGSNDMFEEQGKASVVYDRFSDRRCIHFILEIQLSPSLAYQDSVSETHHVAQDGGELVH